MACSPPRGRQSGEETARSGRLTSGSIVMSSAIFRGPFRSEEDLLRAVDTRPAASMTAEGDQRVAHDGSAAALRRDPRLLCCGPNVRVATVKSLERRSGFGRYHVLSHRLDGKP
jgi:hypothetical protein